MLQTSVDFTEDGYEDDVEIEGDSTSMASSAEPSVMEPEDYQWEHQHGLVLRRGRIYTRDAYKGDFRAELTVDILYPEDEAEVLSDAEGFILGIGFKEHEFSLIPQVFKAVQFYGNHVDLTDSVQAYTVWPHMVYESLVSLEDDEIDDVSPFIAELMPGLRIGDGIVSGENLIVLSRTGGTIKVEVNETFVGEYESEYLLSDYLANIAFDDFDTDLPIRIGVFSACAHTNGDNDEGVFLKSLVIYADEVIDR